jgi:membrane protease YdiL (CAAX protease family)
MGQDGPRIRPLWRAVLYALLFFASGLLLEPGLSFLARALPARLRAGLPEVVDPRFDRPLGTVGIDAICLSLLAAMLVTAFMTAVVERRPFRAVGLFWGRGAASELRLGLGLGVALQTGIVAAAWLCGWAQSGVRGSDAGGALLGGISLFVPAALAEELPCRGYLLPTLTQAWGGRAALVATSVLFGALHGLNPGVSLLAFLGTTAAGVMLGLAYQWTGRLWLPWALHFAWNFAEGSLWGMPVSGLLTPSVVRTQLHGPVLWTGGEFGPEAGLLGLLAVILGTWVLARSFRCG